MSDRMIVTCRDALGRWRPAVLDTDHTASGISRHRIDFDAVQPGDTPRTDGVITGGFTDWHVHLHLSEWHRLADSPISTVWDLGGDPAHLHSLAETRFGAPTVRYAGAFLTPLGGYPSDRDWAPSETYREITDTTAAVSAVQEMAAAGASAIKVASNSTAGPVFSDELFRTIVRASSAHKLPVIAHAEGPGEAIRAARLGAARLAHAPFSEVLSTSEIAALAAQTSWCSTLDIHGWGSYTDAHAIAVANVAAFVRHGGTLLYGTDMGNGPTPVGLNRRELASLEAAGLNAEQLLSALTPGDPLAHDAVLVWVPRNDRGELDIASSRPLATRPH